MAYEYDGAGNIITVTASPIASLTLTDFSPHAGGFGQIVTVHGSGFGPSTILGDVMLGDTRITPIATTASMITFAVPEGAASGRITVEAGERTVTSSADFTVIPDVRVTDFWPKAAPVGALVTVSGFNFDRTTTNNTLQIGAGQVAVQSASLNSLTTRPSIAATTGRITVSNTRGSGTSSGFFFLLPNGYESSDVEFTAELPGTQPVTATTSTAQRVAVLEFEGTKGEYVTLFVGNVTYPGSTAIKVYVPGGGLIYSGTVTAAASTKHALPPLPITGAYTVVLDPASNATGSAAIQHLSNVVVALTPGDAAPPLSFAPGQNGHYTFSGSAGDLLNLGCSSVSPAPSNSTLTFTLYGPSDANLWSRTISAPTGAALPALPSTGTYRMAVTPSGTAGGSVTCMLTAPDFGTVVVDADATAFQNDTVGQQGRFMFTADAGYVLGLALTSYSVSPDAGSLSLTVYAPGGAKVWSASASTVRSWPDLIPADPSSRDSRAWGA
ncbi:MAG: IPT/TIG domain-containing protein [Anaeromyxobacter sp.]